MPWGVAAGVGASLAGSAISSAMSPGTSGGNAGGSYYVPTGLSAADTAWQNALTQQQNLIGQGGGYNQAYLDAANMAAAQYGILGNQLGYNANLLNQQGQGNFGNANYLQGIGQNFYNTAADPQNALYNRTLQQLQEQTGATNSMYGLGSSAAGAGVANQALGNFNIDWQNQQLARQQAGLQGLESAYNAAGQYSTLAGQQIGQGLALQGQVPGAVLNSGYTGYAANQNILNNQLGQQQSLQSQIIPYLNYGQGAQTIPYQSAQQGAGAAGALASQGIQGIGNNPQVQSTLGNAFANIFSPASGSFSGGNFGGAFTSSPYYSGGGNQYGFTM